MSSNTPLNTSNRKKRNRNMFTVVGIGAAAILGLGVVAGSGAVFNDTDTARVDINTATVVLGVSDANNSGTIDLDFNNLKPGQTITEEFSVRNDGSIDAVGNLGSGFTNSTPGENLDYSKLSVGVRAAKGGAVVTPIGGTAPSSTLTPVTQLPSAGWDLGTLKPGQTATFYVDVKLDISADNSWQGKTFGGNLPVTLTQK